MGNPIRGVTLVDSNGNPVFPTAQAGTGTLPNGAATTFVLIPLMGNAGLCFTISGTWAGTIVFYGSTDNGATFPWPVTATNTSQSSSYITTANSSFQAVVTGFSHVKLYFSPYTSGIAYVAYYASPSPTQTILAAPSSTYAGNTYPCYGISLNQDANGVGTSPALLAGSLLLGFNGTAFDRVRKDTYAAGPVWVTSGGSAYVVTASAATTNAAKTGAGRLERVIVTATGTGGATMYDGLTATGNIIGAIAASAPVGTVVQFGVPFTVGLTIVSAASGPALTTTYF